MDTDKMKAYIRGKYNANKDSFLFWLLFTAALIGCIISFKFSGTLSTFCLFITLVLWFSRNRMIKTNREIDETNAGLLATDPNRETRIGIGCSILLTAKKNYYWIIPVVVVYLALITNFGGK